MSRTGVVPHEDVLKSIYEFLSYHGYTDALTALQAESGVAYNVIHTAAAADSDGNGRQRRGLNAGKAVAYPPPSKERLEAAVMDGNWSEVLQVYTDGLLLPQDVRASLYETIFEELLDVHGLSSAASAFFHNAPAFAVMRQTAPARFARLERLLQSFDEVAWEEQKRKRAGALSTETLRRRGEVLSSLLNAIHFNAEPYLGRLPSALYVLAHGRQAAQDVGEHTPAGKRPRMEAPLPTNTPGQGAAPPPSPSASSAAAVSTFLGYPLAAPRGVARTYDCGSDGARSVSCCLTLPFLTGPTVSVSRGESADKGDGGAAREDQSVVALVGRADGSVDFIDARTGAAIGQPVSHPHGVLTMTLDESLAGETAGAATWVAVGYRDGWVKVYNTESRKLVRRFSQPHSMGVTCITFLGLKTPDELAGHHQLLLTGSYDATVKLLSLATGAVVATVQDPHHSAFVNSLCPLSMRIPYEGVLHGAAISAGNDGTLAFWRLRPDAEALIADAAAAEADGGEKPRLPSLLTRVGSNMNVRALHAECKDAVAITLTLLTPANAASESTANETEESETVRGEVLVLTRSAVALVLSVTLDLSSSALDTVGGQPVKPILLCLLRANKPLRHIACVPNLKPTKKHSAPLTVGTTAAPASAMSSSSTAPVLSVYATAEDGTLLLYNVEMAWRDTVRWAAFGGAVVISGPTDESSILITEAGHAVHDARVCPLPLRAKETPAVLACAESLPSMYLLT